MVNSVGACRLAATVCPTSTVRETTTPSTGARMIVCSRSSWVCRNPASFWPTWARADRSWASVTLRAASAERTPASWACSCALFASCWAIEESYTACAASSSAWAMKPLMRRSRFLPRSRWVSTTDTWPLAVWARATACAARALPRSARARSTEACWLSTAAFAASTCALAWLTLASKISGSMRAMT
jgi:hypothetical protein